MKFKVRIFCDYPDEKNVQAALPEVHMTCWDLLNAVQKLISTERDLIGFRVEVTKVNA